MSDRKVILEEEIFFEDEKTIQMMEVELPSEEEIAIQRNIILERALPEKQNVWERLKKIYLGPGLRVIFYHCESAWLVTVFVYLAICAFCGLSAHNATVQMEICLVAFPICYLVFSFISCWAEEQEGVIDLINSMHYSVTYIVSLRMFYSSLVSMAFNLFLLIVVSSWRGQEMWKLGAAGITGMFLFAVFSLYLYHKIGKSHYIGFLILLWLGISVILVRGRGEIFYLLLEILPLTVHLGAAVGSLIVFIIYIRKVEKKDAYSFAC